MQVMANRIAIKKHLNKRVETLTTAAGALAGANTMAAKTPSNLDVKKKGCTNGNPFHSI